MLWMLLLAATLAQDQWPQFRGPDASGVAEDAQLPERWSQTENVAWKTDIPGLGWSSPVVWGDRIFVTSVIPMVDQEKPRTGIYLDGRRVNPPPGEHRWMVYCIDFNTGEIRWAREVHRSTPKSARHLKNSFASETPVTDGERVYAYFGNVGVFVFDMDGMPVWSHPIGPFPSRTGWGTAASPVLHDRRLYIVCDNEEQSFLAAFDARTGKQIWRVERDEKSSWSTPHVWQHDGKTEIVTNASSRIRSYDLEGKLLWELGGASSIAIPTPVSRFGMVYISSGYVQDEVRPVFAVRPGGTARVVASARRAVQHLTAHLRRLLLHLARPRVLDLARRADRQGDLREGPHRSDGRRIYGVTVGLQRTDLRAERRRRHFRDPGGSRYRLLGKNSLDEMTLATPAIARGSLFIRTASRLYRIRQHKETER